METTFSDDDTFDFQPKKAQPYPKPSSSAGNPEKKSNQPSGPLTSSQNMNQGTGLSFSDEDSLLDFQPAHKSATNVKSNEKQQPVKINQSKTSTNKTPQKIESAAGLGLGFTDDDESEFTFSEAIKTNPNRTISPVAEEKKDNQWLEDFLGTQPAHNIDKPKPKPSFDFKEETIKEKSPTPPPPIAKPQPIPPASIQAPVKEPSVQQIVQAAPIVQPQVVHQPVVQQIVAHDSGRLTLVQQQRDDAERRLADAQNQISQLSSKLRSIEADNLDHVNRLKRTHAESVEMIKSEFEAQLTRIKIIHNDEMDAFKAAFGATSDVKDILVKVDNAAASLFSIVKSLEDKPGGGKHAECKLFSLKTIKNSLKFLTFESP